MLVLKIAPALATGNTVILKVTSFLSASHLDSDSDFFQQPSELTPFTALKVAEFVTEAGFPPGVINIVNGYGTLLLSFTILPLSHHMYSSLGHTVGQAICEHHDVRKVAFTGSTLTGRKIMKAAAESNLKPVTLELGGKSPTIVFDDVDIDVVAQQAAASILYVGSPCCPFPIRSDIESHSAVSTWVSPFLLQLVEANKRAQ